MNLVAKTLALLTALLLAVPAAAQAPAPSVARTGNTLWSPGGVTDVRLPVMGTQTANYNPLYTGSTLNPQQTDDSVIIPFNCAAGCVTLMPRSTSSVFPPNHFTCFVNEGVGILQVGTQDVANSPVEGAPLTSNAIQLPQYGSVCLRAKSTNHYEMVGPSVLPGGNYSWTGANKHLGPDSFDPCALTAGATIAVALSPACPSDATKGVGMYTVTLGQNSVFQLPTGLPTGVQVFGLGINHGTGGFTATFAPGYRFTGGSLSGGQPSLTNTANALDEIWCHTFGGTEARCSLGMLNLVAVSTTPATVWSVTRKSANMSLDTTNLIATQNAGNNLYAPVFATTNITTGNKYYWQVTLNYASSSDVGIGIGTATSNVGTGNWLGSGPDTIGYFPVGTVWTNGTQQTPTIASYTSGTAVCVAVDYTAGKIWFQPSGTNQWNGAAIGSQNPGSNVGGFSITGVSSSGSVQVTPGANTFNVNDKATAQFAGACSFVSSGLTGFTLMP